MGKAPVRFPKKPIHITIGDRVSNKNFENPSAQMLETEIFLSRADQMVQPSFTIHHTEILKQVKQLASLPPVKIKGRDVTPEYSFLIRLKEFLEENDLWNDFSLHIPSLRKELTHLNLDYKILHKQAKKLNYNLLKNLVDENGKQYRGVNGALSEEHSKQWIEKIKKGMQTSPKLSSEQRSITQARAMENLSPEEKANNIKNLISRREAWWNSLSESKKQMMRDAHSSYMLDLYEKKRQEYTLADFQKEKMKTRIKNNTDRKNTDIRAVSEISFDENQKTAELFPSNLPAHSQDPFNNLIDLEDEQKKAKDFKQIQLALLDLKQQSIDQYNAVVNHFGFVESSELTKTNKSDLQAGLDYLTQILAQQLENRTQNE